MSNQPAIKVTNEMCIKLVLGVIENILTGNKERIVVSTITDDQYQTIYSVPPENIIPAIRYLLEYSVDEELYELSAFAKLAVNVLENQQ